MEMESQRKGVRKDAAGPGHITSKSIIRVLLCAIAFLLLVGSVASTSRALQNFPAYDTESRHALPPGPGSFRSDRTMTQRDLLDDKYEPPEIGGPDVGNGSP